MYIDTRFEANKSGRYQNFIGFRFVEKQRAVCTGKFNQPSDNRTTPYGICIYDYIVPHDNI